MIIDKQVASRMEACIKQSHIETGRLYPQGRYLEVAGGAACFCGFDSYLSQVVGWGFATKSKHFKKELQDIEQFYLNCGHQRVDIELCPYVQVDLPLFLSEKGYVISELNHVYVFDLHHENIPAVVDEHFTIEEVAPEQGPAWAKNVALGFGYLEAEDQFTRYFQAKGVKAFAAFQQGKIAAGATIAMHGEVGDLGLMSTLPAFRNQGLQKKLLLIRLAFAKNQGLSLATATAVPGSISDKNIQTVGFQIAYTRIKLTKMVPGL